MQRFTEIRVWQQAHKLTVATYRVTKSFPADEQYDVTSQLRRAMASVAANIAEGSKKRTNKDYARFLNTAEGSLAEGEYFLILSRDLEFLPGAKADEIIAECNDLAKRLGALRAKVEANA